MTKTLYVAGQIADIGLFDYLIERIDHHMLTVPNHNAADHHALERHVAAQAAARQPLVLSEYDDPDVSADADSMIDLFLPFAQSMGLTCSRRRSDPAVAGGITVAPEVAKRLAALPAAPPPPRPVTSGIRFIACPTFPPAAPQQPQQQAKPASPAEPVILGREDEDGFVLNI